MHGYNDIGYSCVDYLLQIHALVASTAIATFSRIGLSTVMIS